MSDSEHHGGGGSGRDSHDKEGNGESRRDSRDRDRRKRRSRSDSRDRDRDSRSSRKNRRRSRSGERHRRRYREESRERRSTRRSRSRSHSRSRGRDRDRDRNHKSHSPEQTSSSSMAKGGGSFGMAPASTAGPGSQVMGPSGPMGAPSAMNPTAIAMAAARNLGMPLSMPGVPPQAAAAAAAAAGMPGMPGGMGGGGMPGTHPLVMAQLMRSQQQANAGSPGFGMAGVGGVPGMLGGMGMGMGDKTVRELFVGNTPQGTSDFVLMEFLNAAMKQVNICSQPGNPVISCRVNNKYAFVELRSAEECTKALNLNGIPFMGQMLKIGRPSKYQGPSTVSSTWQKLTGQVSASEVVDPSTKVYRELYVGNTSPDMTDMLLKDFLGNSMQQVGLTTKPGTPIIHTRVSGNFAFVECRCIEEATNLLNLNGIPFMGQELKINRPSKYPGPDTPHLNWADVLARYTSGNPNMSVSAPVGIFRPGVGGTGAMAGAGAGAAAAAAAAALAAAVPPVKATKVLRLNNMLTQEDLEDEEGLGDIEEETKEECEKFGKVTSVCIPRPSTEVAQEKPGVGFVFVGFEGEVGATAAANSLRGRTFDGRKVEVTYWDEDMFAARVFTDKGNAENTQAAATRAAGAEISVGLNGSAAPGAGEGVGPGAGSNPGAPVATATEPVVEGTETAAGEGNEAVVAGDVGGVGLEGAGQGGVGVENAAVAAVAAVAGDVAGEG